jgi:GR25 family glycosyltransferase involved in LPS biosynthesis
MKAFVIRLKGIDSSESLAQECILSGQQHDLHIEPFDGIFGEEDIKNTTARYGIRPFREGMKKNRLGVKGCFLSHYTLWLKCIELNEPLIIFEQDAVVLSPLIENIDSKYKEFLLLDPFNKLSKAYGKMHQESQSLQQSVIEYSNPESRKKYGVTSEYALGLQAYIIKPSAAKKLKVSVMQNGYLPADMQCNKDIIFLETVTKSIASVNKKYYYNKAEMKAESSTRAKYE